MPPDGKADTAANIMNIAQIGMLAVVILLSISYVISKLGNENVCFCGF